jgi:hypothetical protein
MLEPHRRNDRPAPEDLATVLSRVDAMLSRLERGVPAATRPAASRPATRPAAAVAPTPDRPRTNANFSYEGFEEIASPAPRPLPRPVPAGPTVDFLATPKASFEQVSLIPKPDARRWLWTAAAVGLSAVAVASWWSALQHVANDGVRALGAEELRALVR